MRVSDSVGAVDGNIMLVAIAGEVGVSSQGGSD